MRWGLAYFGSRPASLSRSIRGGDGQLCGILPNSFGRGAVQAGVLSFLVGGQRGPTKAAAPQRSSPVAKNPQRMFQQPRPLIEATQRAQLYPRDRISRLNCDSSTLSSEPVPALDWKGPRRENPPVGIAVPEVDG